MFGVKQDTSSPPEPLRSKARTKSAPVVAERRSMFGGDSGPIPSNGLTDGTNTAPPIFGADDEDAKPINRTYLIGGIILGAILSLCLWEMGQARSARASLAEQTQKVEESKAKVKQLETELSAAESKVKGLDADKARLTKELETKSKSLEEALAKGKPKAKSKLAATKHHTKVASR